MKIEKNNFKIHVQQKDWITEAISSKKGKAGGITQIILQNYRNQNSIVLA